jgi:hypothetical protein
MDILELLKALKLKECLSYPAFNEGWAPEKGKDSRGVFQ